MTWKVTSNPEQNCLIKCYHDFFSPPNNDESRLGYLCLFLNKNVLDGAREGVMLASFSTEDYKTIKAQLQSGYPNSDTNRNKKGTWQERTSIVVITIIIIIVVVVILILILIIIIIIIINDN